MSPFSLLIPLLSLFALISTAYSESKFLPIIGISTPTTRIVYQRDDQNQAIIPIKGFCSLDPKQIEARLIAREASQGISTKWTLIDSNFTNGYFAGSMAVKAGWYDLEVRAMKDATVLESFKVERIGVGEVFVAVGHSVAQGGDINIEGAEDDRVSTVSLDEDTPAFDTYKKTGDLKYLPDPVFSKASTGVKPAPFAHGSYFWSKFADLVAKKQNVPVLIYNAAFGGTSLEHWAKSAKGEQFEHGFVKSAIRMPYINLHNTLKKYIPLTGIRAVLADQAANDWKEPNEELVFENYKIWVKQAREDLGYPDLAIVVNRQSSIEPSVIRRVQDRMVPQPNCFPGPDYDKLAKEDRYDGTHLSESGCHVAAQMWADALTEEFFKSSKPWLPSFQ